MTVVSLAKKLHAETESLVEVSVAMGCKSAVQQSYAWSKLAFHIAIGKRVREQELPIAGSVSAATGGVSHRAAGCQWCIDQKTRHNAS